MLNPADSDAAEEIAEIVASLIASNLIVPVGSASLPTRTFWMETSTSLLITLRAADTPMETDPPPRPKEAATEAAPAVAVIVELSSAVSIT